MGFGKTFSQRIFLLRHYCIYPLDLPSKPSPPAILKTPNELGAHSLEQ